MTQRKCVLAGGIVSLLLAPTLLAAQDSWKATEEAAAKAGKAANFAEAERLLTANLSQGPKASANSSGSG
jgi:hypothetical protein